MQNPFQTEWCRGFYAKHRGKLWIAQAVALLAIGFAIAAEPQKFRQQLDDLF